MLFRRREDGQEPPLPYGWLPMRGRHAPVAVLAALASLCLALSASAAPRVTLSASFQPDQLGKSTTVHYGFTVSQPAPLRSLELRLPAGIGFAASSLGLEPCDLALLVEDGPQACPVDSRVGAGSAIAVVPAENEVDEKASVTALFGPPEHEDMTVLFSIEGAWPVNRQIILTSRLLLSATAPYGARLITEAPLVSAWSEGPYIGLTGFHSTIGPQGVTYYRRDAGRTVAFSPRGLTVPNRCPAGGFPVAATFSWWGLNGTATAKTRVPCPTQNP